MTLHEVTAIMRSSGAQEFLGPTDDGGTVLEYSRAGRECTLVIPADGSVIYFLAHGAGVRLAGIAAAAILQSIAEWLSGMRQAFPTVGVTTSGREDT